MNYLPTVNKLDLKSKTVEKSHKGSFVSNFSRRTQSISSFHDHTKVDCGFDLLTPLAPQKGQALGTGWHDENVIYEHWNVRNDKNYHIEACLFLWFSEFAFEFENFFSTSWA